MTDEIKKEDGSDGSEKILADEISDIDSVGSDEPLDADDESNETADVGVTDTDIEKDVAADDAKGDASDESGGEEDKKETPKAADSDTADADDSQGDEEKEKAEGEEVAKPPADESQITKLMNEINRLSGLVEPPAPVVDKKEGADDASVAPDTPHDFLTGIDMDDVSSDPKILNKVLHAVIAKVQQQTSDQILKNLPSEVMEQVNQQMGFKTIVDSFYSDNPDLVNVKAVVKACAQQLHVENPDWEMSKIFAASADRTRETLGISKQKAAENNQQVPSADDAAFAKPSGGSKSNQKSQKSALQRQIDEL
jgi:hypothetical protein